MVDAENGAGGLTESLLEQSPSSKANVEDTWWWRFTHAFAFVLGGTTFLTGTSLLFPPLTGPKGLWSAILYIIGSVGFLYVDVEEFFTFKTPRSLRLNIFLSVIGSTLYIIGSAGFLPSVYAWNRLVGNLGFILGSFFIGSSQIWKLVRISRTSESGIFGSLDSATAACVEGGACLGGWCFFFGTLWYLLGNEDDDHDEHSYDGVMIVWLVGSSFFTLGGLSLAYRHGVMGVV